MQETTNSADRILSALDTDLDRLKKRNRSRDLHDSRIIYAHLRRMEGATVAEIKKELGRSRYSIRRMFNSFPALYEFNPEFKTRAINVFLKMVKEKDLWKN